MKNVNFVYKEEMIDHLIEEFESNDEVTLVVDYDLAKIFASIYDDDEEFLDYYAIDIASDCDEYYIEKIRDEFFTIEPARHLGNYLGGDAKKLIVLEDLLSDELLEAQEAENVEVVSYEEDEDDYCNNDEVKNTENECPGHCAICQCNDENDDSEFEEKLNTKIADLVNIYTEHACFSDECIEHNLWNFSVDLLNIFAEIDD